MTLIACFACFAGGYMLGYAKFLEYKKSVKSMKNHPSMQANKLNYRFDNGWWFERKDGS